VTVMMAIVVVVATVRNAIPLGRDRKAEKI
jgi:hypothetical protein